MSANIVGNVKIITFLNQEVTIALNREVRNLNEILKLATNDIRTIIQIVYKPQFAFEHKNQMFNTLLQLLDKLSTAFTLLSQHGEHFPKTKDDLVEFGQNISGLAQNLRDGAVANKNSYTHRLEMEIVGPFIKKITPELKTEQVWLTRLVNAFKTA